jgi:hypothetical protein
MSDINDEITDQSEVCPRIDPFAPYVTYQPYTPTRLESFTMAAMQGLISAYGNEGEELCAMAAVKLAKATIAAIDQEQAK